MTPKTPPSTPPISSGSRIGLFFRVLQMRLRFIVIFVLAGLVVAYWERIDAWYDRLTRPMVEKPDKASGAFEYRCPMHPSVVRDQPGSCYICGMPLVKRPKGQPVELAADALARIQLTPQKMMLGAVQTSEVKPMLLTRDLYQYGDIEPDQTRVVEITGKVRGRIEELLVNYDGAPVRAGEVLFRQFSEDLFRAQQEYLITLNEEQDRQRTQGMTRSPIGGTLSDAAKRRLLDFGFSEDQIKELKRTKTPELITPIRSPINGFVLMRNALQGQNTKEGDAFYKLADLSKVWLQIRVFEDQLENVKLGGAVVVYTRAFPDQTFIGKVIFIAPMVDPATRTVAARVEVDNSDHQLRPGMYAEAVIRMPAGKVEILPAGEEKVESEKRQKSEPAQKPEDRSPESGEKADKSKSRISETPPAILIPQTVIDPYLRLAKALAEDKSDAEAIHTLDVASAALPEKDYGELRLAIGELSKAKGMEAVREALVPLGDKLIAALKKTGQLNKYFVIFCSMKPGFWLQTGAQVANPFFGSGMLTCGKVMQKPGASENVETQNSKLKTQDSSPTPLLQALAPTTGYYCPLTPDRVYAHPGECPIERAPMIYARLEPVLAVPSSAVIDTGRHKFVYREADPAAWGKGVFDLVEVKLGPEAKGPEGRYYPVLSGLKAGDRVVTRGTFAVDAENRLSGSYPQ